MSAVVLVRRPLQGALRRRLGDERSERLELELLRFALAWGARVAPHAILEAAPDELEQTAARAAAERNDMGGPLLFVSTLAGASLRSDHADAVRSDMDCGLDVSLGPNIDGGWYLLALRTPRPELLAGQTDISQGLLVAQQHGLTVGLMRSERELATPAAARALLLDPLCPAEIRAIIGSTMEEWPTPPQA